MRGDMIVWRIAVQGSSLKFFLQSVLIPCLLVFGVVVRCAAEKFEVAALVDNLDFAAVTDEKGKLLYDTETPAGNRDVLEHVLLTGANTILWRNCTGGTMRYQSEETRYPWVESPLDRRRLPDNRPIYGWLRYYLSEPDILRDMLGVCRERGLRAGIHWPFEDNHWYSWTIGPWTLEHPQFWGVTARGQVWAGRCSLAFPEVVAHKLRLADELLDRGMDHLFVDTWRAGGWSPAYEYVHPEIERWRTKYHTEPPIDASDPRWCNFVAETTHNYFVALRGRLGASGRKVRLMIGISDVDVLGDASDATLLKRGLDWKRLVREGVVDTVVVMNVNWSIARPFESTREIYQSVMGFCKGKCEVLFPVQMYEVTNRGIPSYQMATKLSAATIAGQLLQMAWEEGSDGICLECVDYNNYDSETRTELRRLLHGPCQMKKVNVPN